MFTKQQSKADLIRERVPGLESKSSSGSMKKKLMWTLLLLVLGAIISYIAKRESDVNKTQINLTRNVDRSGSSQDGNSAYEDSVR